MTYIILLTWLNPALGKYWQAVCDCTCNTRITRKI